MSDNLTRMSIKFGPKLRIDGVYECDTMSDVVDCMLSGVQSHDIYSNIPEVQKFNLKVGEKDKFASSEPRILSYDWLIPEYYKNLDVFSYTLSKLDQKITPENPLYQQYFDKVCYELEYFEDSNSMDFLKCIIYVIEKFKMEGIFWGVGRGSSCASLVLYLLDLHKIDPILYKIPEKEFFK